MNTGTQDQDQLKVLEELFNTFPFVFWTANEKGEIMFLNDCAKKILNPEFYTKGKRWLSLFHVGDFRKHLGKWKRSSEEHVHFAGKFRVLSGTSWNSFSWYQINLFPLTVGTEKIWVGSAHSIDNTHLLLADTRTEGHKISFMSNPQAVLLLDRDIKVQFFNKIAFHKAKALFQDEIILGGDIRNFVTAHNKDAFAENIRKNWAGIPTKTELRFKNSDKVEYYRFSFNPISLSNDSKAFTHIILTFEEVTEDRINFKKLHKSYKELQYIDKLQKALLSRPSYQDFAKIFLGPYQEICHAFSTTFFAVNTQNNAVDFITSQVNDDFLYLLDEEDQSEVVLPHIPPPLLGLNKEVSQKLEKGEIIRTTTLEETIVFLNSYIENPIQLKQAVENINLYKIQAISIFPLKRSNGSLLGVIMVFSPVVKDVINRNKSERITIQVASVLERFLFEKALKESEFKLQRANELANLGHWEWDPAKDEVTWSKEIYNFFGLDTSQPAPAFSEHWNFYEAEGLDKLIVAVEKCLQTGKGYEVILKTKPPYGERYFSGRGVPQLDKSGKVVKLYGTLQDVTKQKMSELKIAEQNHQLRNLNQEMDLILQSLSHDLKSPINQAKGLLTTYSLETSEEFKKEIIRLLGTSINKLDNITSDLLEMSLNSRKELTVEQIDWDKLIADAITELEYSEGFDLITWKLSIEQPFAFASDQKRIKVVVRNLLSNAIKYADKEKDLKDVSVHIVTNKTKSVVSISDNGIGIEPEQLDQIFEVFYQANTASKGVGLGLHLVKQTVHKLKGRVEVKSVEKEGTTFSIVLPSFS